MFKPVAAALGAAVLLAGTGFAQNEESNGENGANGDIPEPRVFESSGEVRAFGETIRYDAVAGETYLKNDDGEPIASIFSTTYTRRGGNSEDRPVAFIFNGGPGSASLWLHMGQFGPEIVQVPSDAQDDGAAPYDIGANEYSLLADADLVFIDPVGTGFSRALGDTDPSEFWGVTEDTDSLGQFIRTWLTENQRWNSPKYLIGESYGTTRIGALMQELELPWNNVAINGVVLISTVMDYGLDETGPGGTIGYVTILPSYAATAWHHEKVDRDRWDGDIDAFLDEAREFAYDEYHPALLRGRNISDERREEIVEKLAGFIGLSEDYLDSVDMMVNLNRFRTELLRDERLSVGRFDGRYTADEPDGGRENPEADPSGFGIQGSYTAAMRYHYTTNLGVDITDEYTTLGGVRDWNWDAGYEGGGNNRAINPSVWLEQAMRRNSDLRVLAANGIYDLATPFFATEIVFDRYGYDNDRIDFTYYPAGHMMYLHHPSFEQLAEDVRDFIREE